MIKIAIADDHNLIRKGIVEIINSFQHCQVVIEADNGEKLVTALHNAATLPDICILDINMPVMDGYETLKAIREAWPEMNVLALTMYSNELAILKMILGGAKGYLPKDCTPRELEKAIDNVYHAGVHSSELAPKELFEGDKSKYLERQHRISDKDIQFLRYCCTELHYKEIADIMEVSVRTIHTYRDNLFEKLGLKTRIGLAMYAMNIGLGPADIPQADKKE